jgi:hypothetical protein
MVKALAYVHRSDRSRDSHADPLTPERTRLPSMRSGNLDALHRLPLTRAGDADEREASDPRAAGQGVGRGTPSNLGVRIRTGPEATRDARSIGAAAYSLNSEIVIDETVVDLGTRTGRMTLAHELAHTRQSAGVIRRQTAEEIKRSFEGSTLGFTTLNEDGLGHRIAGLVRTGQGGLARQVITILDSSDRDDVSQVAVGDLTILELVHAARSDEGRAVLGTMREELSSGFVSGDERDKANLLGAVLEAGPERTFRNRRRITELGAAGTDLDALATMFSDDQIIDDETIPSRLRAILDATEHIVIPGLQTGIEFGDTGFRGEPTPDGSGFRDPHPSSRNQVGHFLTAVGLEFSPEIVAREIPFFGTVRAMVGAPATMSDADVALRLTIGHEKSRDPNGGAEVLVNVLLAGGLEFLRSGPEGETDDERNQRVGRAAAVEGERQVREIIAAFQAQFAATTDADIAAWNEALARFRSDGSGLEGPDSPLNRIAVNPALKGNSRQDLRLSLVGYALGQMIGSGAFADRAAVAAFIRRSLGPAAP